MGTPIPNRDGDVMNRKTPLSPFLGIFLVIVPLLFGGCVAPGDGGTTPGTLDGTAWDLVSYLGGNGTMVSALPNTRVTAVFSAGGSLGGSAGCNHYFGEYTADGGSLTIRGIGSTLMACLDPGIMEQESRYLSLLGSAARFRTDGGRLVISAATGGTILTFERELPPAPLPLTGTTWVLESISTGSGAVSSVLAGTEIHAFFSDEGRVTGSAGCNQYFADFNRTGNSLGFGPIGSTKMYCGEPDGRMAQEQAYLSLLGSVTGYEISGGRLILKDSQGSGVLTYRAS
jgi:heat shock protein HslJ